MRQGPGLAENCIVAAEGQLQHNGRFKVTALGMPPNERREESLIAAKVWPWRRMSPHTEYGSPGLRVQEGGDCGESEASSLMYCYGTCPA